MPTCYADERGEFGVVTSGFSGEFKLWAFRAGAVFRRAIGP